MKITGLLLGCLLSFTAFAQSSLTTKQVQQDYQIFKNILQQGHPGLYAYTSKQKWDSIFQHFESEEIKSLKTSQGLFKSLNGLANHIKDGHFRVLYPTMTKAPPMFPVWIKIIGGKIYSDTDDFGIPVGTEIISINDVGYQELLQRLMKYTPSDGYNLTKKYRQIEDEFGILLYYEFGYQTHFQVSYQAPNQAVKTKEIESQSFESIGQRFAQRNSLFREYRHLSTKYKPKNSRLPYVYFFEKLKTAVLTVNSFGINPKAFKSRLIGLLKQVKKKKTKNLIIDVRQNDGGFRANAITLFSYISSIPFKQRVSESFVTQKLPELQHVFHTLSSYPKLVKEYFKSAKKQGNRWVLTMDRAEPMMRPQKKRFKGKVYVLIGGTTFSAGVAFALNARNDGKIQLIGEETGGGYYFHIGQYPVVYKLPNSKILVRMSLVRVNKYVKDNKVPKGRGVLPHYKIELTLQDLIRSQDSQLNFILRKIKEQKQK